MLDRETSKSDLCICYIKRFVLNIITRPQLTDMYFIFKIQSEY